MVKLNISKAARSFIFPMIVILIYDILFYVNDWPAYEWQASSLLWSFLSRWQVALPILIVSLFLYVWLRIKHMVALYKLIVDADVFSFDQTDRENNVRKIICVANVVSPVDVLKIFEEDAGTQARSDQSVPHRGDSEQGVVPGVVHGL